MAITSLSLSVPAIRPIGVRGVRGVRGVVGPGPSPSRSAGLLGVLGALQTPRPPRLGLGSSYRQNDCMLVVKDAKYNNMGVGSHVSSIFVSILYTIYIEYIHLLS